jgi:hypothetical protein
VYAMVNSLEDVGAALAEGKEDELRTGDLMPLAGRTAKVAGAAVRWRTCTFYVGPLRSRPHRAAGTRAEDPEEGDDLLRLGLHRLPSGSSRLRGLAGELAGYDGERELDEGLDIILAGLRPRMTSRNAGE